MKPIQLRIAATLAFLALAPCVGHGYVTYTWKGGDGNWSDPDMWTADDEATGYPNAEDAIAQFPAGITNTVVFTEDIVCWSVKADGEGTWMTFTSDETRRTLTSPKISGEHGFYANGKGCSFTMDNVKLSGGGGKYGTAGTSFFRAPGEGGILRLVNTAHLDYVRGHLNAKNATLLLEAGTQLTVGSCYIDPSKNSTLTMVVSNAYASGTFDFPTTAEGDLTIRLQGDNPQFQPQKAVGGRPVFEFELPSAPYRRTPLLPVTALANMVVQDVLFKVSKRSPALRDNYTNTWRVVSWEPSNASYAAAGVGIPTNDVTWAGLRRQDSISYGWKTSGTNAQDPETANPAYMYLTLGPKPGMSIIFK